MAEKKKPKTQVVLEKKLLRLCEILRRQKVLSAADVALVMADLA